MISPDAEPISHIPPRRPIDLRPVYPDSQRGWEAAIAEEVWALKVERGELLWAVVVEFAKGRGVIPQPLARERASDALIESEGLSSVIYDDGLFMGEDDDRNSTEIWMTDPILLEVANGGRNDQT